MICKYKSTKMKFLEEMSIVAEAVAKAMGAEKMNYGLLGNGDTHLHWHLFPRVSGNLEDYGNNGKGPVWWYPRGKSYCNKNFNLTNRKTAAYEAVGGCAYVIVFRAFYGFFQKQRGC